MLVAVFKGKAKQTESLGFAQGSQRIYPDVSQVLDQHSSWRHQTP